MRSNSADPRSRITYHSAAHAVALVFAVSMIGAQSAAPPSAPPGQTASPTSTAPSEGARPSPNQAPGQTQPTSQPVTTLPKALIMIDPAHGGTESGAVLNPTILEKDVTLALARRLRTDLGERGFVAELVRDSDVNLSTDDRAAKANSAHPALYICLHATSASSGIGIYTAMLPGNEETNGPFLDWDTAQSSFLPQSRAAQQEIAAGIQKGAMAVRSLAAPLRPLGNVSSAAVAVELAPTKSDVSQLSASEYQHNISTALANGIAQFLSSSGAAR